MAQLDLPQDPGHHVRRVSDSWTRLAHQEPSVRAAPSGGGWGGRIVAIIMNEHGDSSSTEAYADRVARIREDWQKRVGAPSESFRNSVYAFGTRGFAPAVTEVWRLPRTTLLLRYEADLTHPVRRPPTVQAVTNAPALGGRSDT